MPYLRTLDDELYTVLAEECAEVIQAISKIRRHGEGAYNPLAKEPELNITHLHREVGDLLAVIELMMRNDMLQRALIERCMTAKMSNLKHGKFPLHFAADINMEKEP